MKMEFILKRVKTRSVLIRIAAVWLFINCGVLAEAQGSLNFPTEDISIPSSPTAMAFRKYGDYPVDYCNGLAQISIPLHEINFNGLSHSINVSFHSSGIKVNEVDGILGWGWSLNAGGMVSRNVNGAVDETMNTIYPIKTDRELMPTNENDYFYIDRFAKNQEGQFDDFYFNISSNLRGKFVIVNENGIRRAVVIDRSDNIIINCIPSQWSLPIEGFEIIDGNGIKYSYLGPKEAVIQNGTPSGGVPPYTSGWMLSEISNLNTGKKLEFEYIQPSGYNEEVITPSHFSTFHSYFTSSFTPGPAPETSNHYSFPDNYSFYKYSVPRISKIKYPNGQIEFIYSENTTNLHGSKDVLDKILIKPSSSEIFREIVFQRKQSNHSTRTKLDFIDFKDNEGQTYESVTFEYYGAPSSDPTYDFNRDFWGYPNRIGNNHYIPDNNSVGLNHIIPFWEKNVFSSALMTIRAVGGGANREVDENSTLYSGVIKEVKYSTGASTNFIYESNRYFNEDVKPYHF